MPRHCMLLVAGKDIKPEHVQKNGREEGHNGVATAKAQHTKMQRADAKRATMLNKQLTKTMKNILMHSRSVTTSSFSLKHNGLMVDCGAKSHIIMEIEKFQNFDDTFQPERHAVELADGARVSGVAMLR